jgi:phosphoribosyl 1,2-cyclic phosphate phosphodiesterase
LIEKSFEIQGVKIGTFPQAHGSGKSRGFRFGNIAYTTDVTDFPEESLPFLENLDIWIIDCLTARPHPSHMDLKGAIDWAERMKPKRTILTHMNHTLDYGLLKVQLPKGVEPAFDGMRLEF